MQLSCHIFSRITIWFLLHLRGCISNNKKRCRYLWWHLFFLCNSHSINGRILLSLKQIHQSALSSWDWSDKRFFLTSLPCICFYDTRQDEGMLSVPTSLAVHFVRLAVSLKDQSRGARIQTQPHQVYKEQYTHKGARCSNSTTND